MITNKYLTGFPLLLVMFAVSLATFMIVLDYSIANVSIPYISGDLAVSTDQGTYVITSFAVGNSIVLPMTGWLTKRIGAVKLITISLLLFVVFSWTCGAAPNLQFLVVSRFIQGLVSGPLIPLSQTLLIQVNHPDKKNAAMGFWSAIVIAAPILGPLLGGWISYDYHWPWIFYINIPVGIAAAIIIWLMIREYETPIEKPPMDWLGLILLAVGVSCLQVFLDKGEQYDWLNSYWMRTFIVTSTASFIFLFVWEFTHPTPLLDLRLLKKRSYALSIIFIGVAYAIYFGTVVLVPLWLQTNMNYTAPWAGIAVAPIGLAPFILATLSGKMVTKFGNLIPLGISFAFFAISSFYTCTFTTQVDLFHIGFSRFLLGCALFFFLTPLLSLCVQDLPNEKLASGTGIFHFVRAMVGGTGTSVFVTMWIRRTEYYHERIGEVLTPYSHNTTQFLDYLKTVGFKGQKSLAQLNNMVDNEAAMLAINDSFYFMGWVFVGLIFLVPLAITRKKSSAAPIQAIEH